MGAGGSQPAHYVEVRLERPSAPCPSNEFFITLHTAASGVVKYRRAWGEPQRIGLWADDIITVSVFAAQGGEHFDRHQCEDVSEIYLPWDTISRQFRESGKEVAVDLALTSNAWLGQSAEPSEYRQAYRSAVDMVRINPMTNHIHISIRESSISEDAANDHSAHGSLRNEASATRKPSSLERQSSATQTPRGSPVKLQDTSLPSNAFTFTPRGGIGAQNVRGYADSPAGISDQIVAGDTVVRSSSRQGRASPRAGAAPPSLGPVGVPASGSGTFGARGRSHTPEGGGLTPEDVRQVALLEQRQQELRAELAKLGVTNTQLPQIPDEHVAEYTEGLRNAVAENSQRRLMIQRLSKDLAVTQDKYYKEHTKEEAKAPFQSPFPSRGSCSQVEGNNGFQRCAELVAELRNNMDVNTELIWKHNDEVRKIENEISDTREQFKRVEEQAAKHGAVNPEEREEARRLLAQRSKEIDAISEECEIALECFNDEVRRQRTRQHFERERQAGSPSSAPLSGPLSTPRGVQAPFSDTELRAIQNLPVFSSPATSSRDPDRWPTADGTSRSAIMAKLRGEAERLAAQLESERRKAAQSREAVAQQTASLRQENTALCQHLEHTQSEHQHLTKEMQMFELTQSQGGARGTIDVDLEQQRGHRDALIKDLARSKRRIDYFDEKICQLVTEAADIKRRAFMVQQTVPDLASPRGAASQGAGNHQSHMAYQARDSGLAFPSASGLSPRARVSA